MAGALTEYERLRNENIARNADRLAQLGLIKAAEDIKSTPQRKRPASGGRNQLTNKAKRPKEPSVPVRRSLRSLGLTPDGEGMEATTNPANPRVYTDRSSRGQRQMSLSADNEAPSVGPMKMKSNNAEEAEDDKFVDMLRTVKDEQSLRDRGGVKQEGKKEPVDHSKFQLHEDDVAKVVKERIYTLEFLPLREKLIVAAGDKMGQLGLWEVGGGASPSGVFNYTLHTKPVAGLVCSPHDCTKIFTCSYDGSVRMMDVNAGNFQESARSADSMFSTCCLSREGHEELYLGDYEGGLTVLDRRENKTRPPVELHEKKINSLQFNPTRPHLLISSSTDASARLWDIRKLSGKAACKPLSELQHSKAVHGAYFSRGGDQLACTSYDNTVSIWSGSDGPTWKKTATIRHNNTTGRWLTAFRAMWAFDDSHLIIGSMNRCIDIVATHPPHMESTLASEHCGTVPARVAVHPLLPVIAAGNASGRVFIWKIPSN